MESTALHPPHDRALRHDGAASHFCYLRGEGGIEEYQLASNGLRLLFMAMPAAPVAALMLTYAVGSGHETSGFEGASHMLEHMMFKGTPRFNKQDGTSIINLLHPVGAQTNATTWLDRTNYFNLVPTSHLELAAEIEADRMRNLRIDAADLEAERSVVLNEHDRYAGDPLEKLNQAVWGAAFASDSYGAPVLGTRADIGRFTRDGLLAHYDRFYRPNNATVSIIGDVERESALDIVGRHFAGLQATEKSSDVADSASEQEGERRLTLEHAERSAWVMLAYKAPNGLDPDADALELLGSILVGGKLSRLYRPLVGAGLATHAWSSCSRLRRQGLFQVQALLRTGQQHDRVEQLIRDAIAEIRGHGVTPQELDRAKGQARGTRLTSRDGPLAIAMQLNEAIAVGDWTSYPKALDGIAAVTRFDLQQAACRYLRDERLTVGHLVHRAEQP